MASSREKSIKPRLPARQLAILGVVRFAEPLALTSVFPYLPEMIKSFGVPQDEVAKWAGFTSACFSFSQSTTAVLWGRTSDTIGRKPTLIIGLICTMLCFLAWGMSTSLAMAITVRAIQGCSNGNVGTIRTMVAEMVPEKSLQPVAFSIMPMIWSVGSVFGPAFGGVFARPAEQYPRLFGNSWLLNKFPFLLPNMIACIFFLCSLLTATLFLKETLETRRGKADWGRELGKRLVRACRGKSSKESARHSHAHEHEHERSRRMSYVDDEASAPLLSDSGTETDFSPDGETPPVPVSYGAVSKNPAPADPPAEFKFFTHQTVMVLLNYTLLALHSVAYDQLLPVFLNHPYQTPDDTNTRLPFKFSGGFGMSSNHIGAMFTLTAIISAVCQFLIFPPMCSRFGELTCYRWACAILPFVYLGTPYTVLLPTAKSRYAAFLCTFIAKGCLGIVTFPCITIILTNSAPSTKVLGTINGLATTVSGLGRAIGPALTGSAFTYGVQHGYVIVGWWFLAFISTLGAVAPFFITPGAGIKVAPIDDEIEEELANEDENNDFSDDDCDDYEEALLPVAHDEDYINAQPLLEPEDPEPYTAEGTRFDNVDAGVPTTPRTGRFRSLSSLPKNTKDAPKGDGVPMSPVSGPDN